MAWITTRKTEYGFEYCIGSLVVARAVFVKRGGEWQVEVIHMVPVPTKSGTHTCEVAETMPLRHVTAYLHRVTKVELPPPAADRTEP